MPCNDCPNRHLCNQLCPEAELAVSRDEVPLKELPIGLPRSGRLPNLVSNIYLTKREKQICTLLGSGLTRVEVAQVLEISISTVRSHLNNLKKKLDA